MPSVRTIVAILILACACTATAAPDVEISALAYAHNLEYTNAGALYRPGETFFGHRATVAAVHRPTPELELALGLLVDAAYGDDPADAWERVTPWFRLDWDADGPFGLRLGNLDKRDQTLLPALYDPVLVYQRGGERGLALRWRDDGLRHDTWMHWQQRNTADHREKFDVSSTTTAAVGPLTANLQVHVVHWGGQLHHQGSVADSWAAAGGLAWRHDGDQPLEIAARGYRSHYVLDRELDLERSGHGFEALVATDAAGWRLEAARWFGDGWLAADGRPFHQADDLTSWSVRREWRPGDVARAELGFTGHHVDDDFEQEFWFVVDLAPVLLP